MCVSECVFPGRLQASYAVITVCVCLSLWIQLVLCQRYLSYVCVNCSPIIPMTVMREKWKVQIAFEPDAGWLFWVSFIVGFGERLTIVLVKASVCLCVCARVLPACVQTAAVCRARIKSRERCQVSPWRPIRGTERKERGNKKDCTHTRERERNLQLVSCYIISMRIMQ